MRTRILVFIGPHGSGKTTLGRLVAEQLGWKFDEEIGALLRKQALASDANAHALSPVPAFDAEVFHREMNRDLERGETPRVVETWHPGNLAYAEMRNPGLAKSAEPILRAAARRSESVLIQPLMITQATALKRLREPGPRHLAAWFHAVGVRALEIARTWQLPCAEPIATDDLDPAQASAEIVLRISRL